jgi:hypothetical protein
MAIEEQSVIDLISVTEIGTVEIRRADRVVRDGEVIANTYHRHTLIPGDSLDGQDDRVVAVAQAVWTPEVLDTYQRTISKSEPIT